MKQTPIEKIFAYAEKQKLKEREKYASGMKNTYFEWEDACAKLTQMQEICNQNDAVRTELEFKYRRALNLLKAHGLAHLLVEE